MRVYASLPLSGWAREAGREVLRGAELALERMPGAAELVVADTAGEDREALAIEHARRAAADPDAIAYLGDFHSSQLAATAPLLSEARLLQVAPVATWTGLRGDTLVRIAPHDGVGARAIAAWLDDAGVGELLIVHDHDEGYGVPVAGMCADAARESGLHVRSRPVWDHDEPPAEDLGSAEAVLYVGVAGSGAVDLWRQLHEADPALWLVGSDGVALPWFAAEMGPAEATRTRFFVPLRAPLAFYGFEAMALILDSLGGDRGQVAARARSARDRDSVLGRYSLDEKGHTTSTAYGRLRVENGELLWDRVS
jgi:branched-chain amino acid transport system substrate-binding protein